MARFLIGIGVAMVLIGLAWPLVARLGLGRLPGDIVIERDGFRLYIPIVTSLLVSAAISIILWIARR